MPSLPYLAAVACVLTACACSSSSTSVPPRSTEADGACSPRILINPATAGDIPSFVARLASAYCGTELQTCNDLPTPRAQTFDAGDYTVMAPSRGQWLSYCRALVAADPGQCLGVERGSEPDLQASCVYFFQQLAERDNDSPAFCLGQIGQTYHSWKEVRNCLLGWSAPIYGSGVAIDWSTTEPVAPFTRFDLDLLGCLQLPKPSAITPGANQHECLFDLAAETRDERVCLLIDNPYANQLGANVWSQPNCLAQFE